MSLDGYCDHTGMLPDGELHDHFTAMLKNAGAVLYGRITYQLMESFWPTVAKNPTGEKHMDDFALAIDNVPKVLFSRTVKSVSWKNTTLAKGSIQEEVMALRKQPGKDIFAGSPSLIVALTQLNLVDEYQLCVHPVIVGSGLPLFKNISERRVLKLTQTKTFKSGIILVHYEPVKS